MEDSTNFARFLIDSLTEHIVVIDNKGIIQYVNTAWIKFGFNNGISPSKDWIGLDYLAASDAAGESGEDNGRIASQGIRNVMKSNEDFFYLEYPCHSETEKRWFMMKVTRLGWAGPDRYVISHHNITDRKLAEEKLSRLSLLDGLTGVSNRRHFDFFLNNEWRRALRQHKQISLIIFDIDYFKKYNDNYGHLAGDECLKKVGRCIGNFGTRPGDLVARYGGEEFAIILADADSGPAAAIAEQVRIAINDLGISHEFSEIDTCVTVSIGVATFVPKKGETEKDLIHAADELLYKSKKAGRNRVSAGTQ